MVDQCQVTMETCNNEMNYTNIAVIVCKEFKESTARPSDKKR